MKEILVLLIFLSILGLSFRIEAQVVDSSQLCMGAYYTEIERTAALGRVKKFALTLQELQQRAAIIKKDIQEGAQLGNIKKSTY